MSTSTLQVSVEKTSSLGRKLKIVVPKDNIENKKKQRMQEVAKTAKLPGFRPGKIPSSVLEKNFGKQVRNEIVANSVDESLNTALEQEKLTPAERPKIEELKDEKDQDLSFTVSFETFPKIELKDFSEITVEKLSADISDADIDKGISKLQEQFASFKEVDRAAKDTDRLTIDFVGEMDGKAFDNGSAKDFKIEIGSGHLIPGFEDGLKDLKKDDKKTLNLKFPDDYNAKDLAGKEVDFKVEVKLIEERTLAELNEEFAKKIGLKDIKSEDFKVDLIRDKVKSNMEEYLDKVINDKLQEEVLDKLLEQNEIEVPNAIIEREKKSLKTQAEANRQVLDSESLEKEALKRTSLGLLLNEVIASNKLELEPSRLDAKLDEISKNYDPKMADMIKNYYMQSKELMQNLQSTALTEQAIELVVSKVTTKEKKSNFYDIVK